MPALLKVYCCSDHKDLKMLRGLLNHLVPLQENGKITIWSEVNLVAGNEHAEERRRHLEDADIILLLSSPHFHASASCRDDMKRAIERYRDGSAHVIPVLLSPMLWKDTPLG